jgi:isoamylase
MLAIQENKNYHGIVAPLFSIHTQLSSGIGEYLDLIPLIDWCQTVGLDIIQLLPLNDTGEVISPYSPISGFALNPIYLTLSRMVPNESLRSLRALTCEEQIPYEKILKNKEEILRDCFEEDFSTLSKSEDYQKFLNENSWLQDYAKYKILKEWYPSVSWKEWPKNNTENFTKTEIDYHLYVQFLCFSQMSTVKKYADSKNVLLKGDIPFLIAFDSADVWKNPELFLMEFSAGAPPDQFNADGQNWSAPIYNWNEKFEEILKWWRERLRVAESFYHFYRLDHVVGLFRVWAIPNGLAAINGHFLPSDPEKWIPQGKRILKYFLESTSMKPIAEDLGVVPEEVREVLSQLGIPGTKVMRWEKTPLQKFPSASMTTVSTHDTETLAEWLNGDVSYEVLRNILFSSHHSASKYHINLLQEYFPLIPGFSRQNIQSERINIPGKVLQTNWRYRFLPSIEEIKANTDFEILIKSMLKEVTLSIGSPKPLGVTHCGAEINFAFYAAESTELKLCLYQYPNHTPFQEIVLDSKQNRTGNVWHISINGLPDNLSYGYYLDKHPQLILDPYAKAVHTSPTWGDADYNYIPFGLVPKRDTFDWEDDKPLEIPRSELVLYEMHVRGFTQDLSSKVDHPGSFLGIIEKIPYLKELGVNAIKLMPIQEFNECEYKKNNPYTKERLFNFWGYSTVNYFSPMNRYATNGDFFTAVTEFKMLVKEMHRHGIEVILDIVFNHTAEGIEAGPIYSFLGIDPQVYYMFDENNSKKDFTGCGNTLNCNHPIVRRLILTCLEYWVSEMHVDGFRFDLAAVFARGVQGEALENSPLIEEISDYPILAKTKLIAEPWDVTGFYKLGSFFTHDKRWSEWNDQYRDSIRSFLKGDLGTKTKFATRICGSEDVFGSSKTPCTSINFITAHDGFTLRDLVSFNTKHNLENGEENRDGNPHNLSWNCGEEGEGETYDVTIIKLRDRQMRNFHLTLMVSQGVPMLTMGNEYGHTRRGNNNTWCQDNALNWFMWDQLSENQNFYRFYRGLIKFRTEHSILHLDRFLDDQDIQWHGIAPLHPDWENDLPVIAFSLSDTNASYSLYIAFNASSDEVTFTVPRGAWKVIANTANPSPSDFYEESEAPLLGSSMITLIPHSSVILKFCFS